MDFVNFAFQKILLLCTNICFLIVSTPCPEEHFRQYILCCTCSRKQYCYCIKNKNDNIQARVEETQVLTLGITKYLNILNKIRKYLSQ